MLVIQYFTWLKIGLSLELKELTFFKNPRCNLLRNFIVLWIEFRAIKACTVFVETNKR